MLISEKKMLQNGQRVEIKLENQRIKKDQHEILPAILLYMQNITHNIIHALNE
jgi:hypothetical protein